MTDANVIVQTMLACQKLIAVGTVQSNQLFFEYLIAIDPHRFGLWTRFLFLLDLLEMEALDVTVEIIFHLEESLAVRTFEHVGLVELLVDCSHVIFHRVETREGFVAELALRDAVGCPTTIH